MHVCCYLFQTKLLCQYVLNLAKYDQSYDIRDRARFLRQLLIPSDTVNVKTYLLLKGLCDAILGHFMMQHDKI